MSGTVKRNNVRPNSRCWRTRIIVILSKFKIFLIRTLKDGRETLLILILVLFVYSLIGGAIMMALEQTNEETATTDITTTLSTFLTDHSSCMTNSELAAFLSEVRAAYDSGVLSVNGSTTAATQWDFGNSYFFVLTAITTIGYGNQTPATKGGQAFIVIFCFNRNSKGWTYGEAIYYSLITFTTIGFGDFVVGTENEGGTRIVYKLLVIIWIFIGLACLVTLIGECTDTLKAFTEKREKEKVKDGNNIRDTDKDVNIKTDVANGDFTKVA
ncbi:K2P10.1 [Mytilus edulis]|uniref:KCNK10 n=1 Tax=Mytilus edulis TaxID=6550 RepID=A0A8S3QGG5_MYTED|nr:K2P10.1 [Mytilus edulis]